jgi:death-on-curing protein
MNYPTRQEILDLHGYLVEHYGGKLGITSQDRLIAAVDAPQQVMFGSELYPDLPSKASVLAFQLIKNRPFRSCNEATALLALLHLLEANGATVDVDDLAGQLSAVGRSQLEREGLEQWLRGNVK